MSVTAAVDEVEDPSAERVSPLVVGVVVWLASEVMFFGGLFAAWFVLRAHNAPNWPPSGDELDVIRMGVSTLILILSSVTVHLGVRAQEHQHPTVALRWWLATIALGLAFVGNQAVEYTGLASGGMGFGQSAFSTIFYLLTGFHGAHVIGGLVLMAIVAWVVFSPGTRTQRPQALRVTSYYWHFVDVVWIVLFLVVYVLK